jgi:sugar phosphate isomerase/epimerase
VFLHSLENLLPHAESCGLVITLENPGDGDDDVMGSGEDGAALIRKIGSPNIRLNCTGNHALHSIVRSG